MNVLVIGSGGREHAIAYALAKSEHVDKLFALPGNPGIAEIGTCIPGSVEDLEGNLRSRRKQEWQELKETIQLDVEERKPLN